MEQKKLTPKDILAKKQRGEKMVRIAGCYDYTMALLADRAGADTLAVGDSVAMAVMGLDSTLPVTMEEMLHHCKAASRAVKHAVLTGDLPFLSYQTCIRDAVYNAGLLMKFGGVDVVKLEGGEEMAPTIKAIVNAGIPVMGHLGLTPQSVTALGGYKVQGTDTATACKLIRDARILQEVGICMLALECVPDRLAGYISQELTVPVFGIGSGPYTDGQALISYDILGLFERFTPKFVKKYANFAEGFVQAFKQYKEEVEKSIFPGAEHSYHIKDEVLQAVLKEVGSK